MIESNKNEKDNDIELKPGLQNIELKPGLQNIELKPGLQNIELKPRLQYIESENIVDESSNPVKKQKRKCMRELIYV